MLRMCYVLGSPVVHRRGVLRFAGGRSANPESDYTIVLSSRPQADRNITFVSTRRWASRSGLAPGEEAGPDGHEPDPHGLHAARSVAREHAGTATGLHQYSVVSARMRVFHARWTRRHR